MRRAQKQPKWKRQVQQHRGPSWFPVEPLVYTCALPPKPTLAHKWERILNRLAKGGEKLLKTGKGAWQWTKGSKAAGYVKAALLYAMHKVGLVQCIGGQWLITADGRKAVGL